MKPGDLEERLIEFAVRVVGVVEALPDTKAGNHIARQLVRSELLLPQTMVKLKVQNHAETFFTK